MQNKEAKPAVDAARSVDTGVMAATVLNGTLVDVLALQCLNVQSAREQDFFLQSKLWCFPTSILARKNIQRCPVGLCMNLSFEKLRNSCDPHSTKKHNMKICRNWQTSKTWRWRTLVNVFTFSRLLWNIDVSAIYNLKPASYRLMESGVTSTSVASWQVDAVAMPAARAEMVTVTSKIMNLIV